MVAAKTPEESIPEEANDFKEASAPSSPIVSERSMPANNCEDHKPSIVSEPSLQDLANSWLTLPVVEAPETAEQREMRD